MNVGIKYRIYIHILIQAIVYQVRYQSDMNLINSVKQLPVTFQISQR